MDGEGAAETFPIAGRSVHPSGNIQTNFLKLCNFQLKESTTNIMLHLTHLKFAEFTIKKKI